MKGPERLLYSLRLGTYKLLILSLAMRYGKVHGYWIKKEIYKDSLGMLSPSEGTIYQALKQLTNMGLLKPHWEESERGGMVKVYEVPEEKRAEVERLLKLAEKELETILKVLRGD